MTNEEAIDLLDNLIGMIEDNHESDYDTALQMAKKALEFIDKIEPMFGDMLDIPKALEQEQAQADGEYISRTAIEYINAPIAPVIQGEEVHYEWVAFRKQIEQLQSVAIPPDHDGCKDCKYETYPEYYYPCCNCKQNYKDEWEKKPHWNHGVCDNCGYDWGKDAPIASVPNFCPNCGCPMEIER